MEIVSLLCDGSLGGDCLNRGIGFQSVDITGRPQAGSLCYGESDDHCEPNLLASECRRWRRGPSGLLFEQSCGLGRLRRPVHSDRIR